MRYDSVRKTTLARHMFSPDGAIERRIFFWVNDLAVDLSNLVARRGTALQDIEWRDLERVVAVALDGIGFEVTLTPSSQDGGKDVIAKCTLNGKRCTYYIEIKHWTSGKRVGIEDIKRFVEVNVKEGTDGGLFLSSSGYATPVYAHLSEISEKRIRFGQDVKIVSLCQHFVQTSGRALWTPQDVLPQILFERTIS
jgi:restriction system protein